MIAETKTGPVETKPPGVTEKMGERIENLKNELAPRWSEFWTSSIDAAGAECSIVALKAARTMVAAALGILALLGLIALGVYGFILLDACFDYALHGPNIPIWVSPLVRGVLYFGLMAGAFGMTWGYLFGTGESTSSVENVTAKEAARG
jgi:hypothetical protein